MGNPVEQEKKLWFKAKWFGWGWYPSTWQGWYVLIGCIVVGYAPLFYVIRANRSNKVPKSFWISMGWLAAWIMILIYICYKKGEKPHWRWGK